MSEEKPTENVEALKARIAELEAENEKLKATVTEATKILTAYVEKEREAAIKAIMEKTTLSKDELEKLDLAQLRLIQADGWLPIPQKGVSEPCHLPNLPTRFWFAEIQSLKNS